MNLTKRDPAATEPEPAAPAGSAVRSRRTLLAVGGAVAGLALLGTMAFVLVSGGGDEPTGSGSGTLPRRAAAATTTSQPAVTSAIPSYDGTVGRDPFKPLVVEAAAAASGGAASASSATSAGSTSGSTGSTGSTSSTGSTASRTTTGPALGGLLGPLAPATTRSTATPTTSKPTATRTKAAQVLRLRSVESDNSAAVLLVDAKSYTVAPGRTFATYYKLMSLRDGGCGTVQYADSIFDICKGQSRTLR